MPMLEFLRDNSGVLFAAAGAVGATLLTFLSSWLLSKRDYGLRLWEKLVDRRISAHDAVMSVALEMRVTVPVGGVDQDGEIARAPQAMISKEVFEEWFRGAIQRSVGSSTWLCTKAKHEANFLQDYLATLHTSLANVETSRYLAIGQVIRQDFIEIADALEKAAFSFFEHDIHRFSAGNLGEWHKFPKDVTLKRLNQMRLLTDWDEIKRVVIPVEADS